MEVITLKLEASANKNSFWFSCQSICYKYCYEKNNRFGLLQFRVLAASPVKQEQVTTPATSETTTKFYGDKYLVNSIFFNLVFLMVFLKDKNRQQPPPLAHLLQLVLYGYDSLKLSQISVRADLLVRG